MMKTILEILKEESNQLGISQLELVRYARKGCHILFGDNLNHRVELLKEFRSTERHIRETILLCMVGGALGEAVDNY